MYYTETENLLYCLKAGVSAYHTVQYAGNQLKKEGFIRLKKGEKWQLEKGESYYVELFGTSLFAFHIPENYNPYMPLHGAAAHTDWPNLRIKSLPEMRESNYQKLNVEVYGGPIYYSWLDRPLSIAGAVCVKVPDRMYPKMHLVDFRRPMAIIPSLAIHYNRDVNNGIELNAQTDLAPLLDVVLPEWKQDGYFTRLIAEEMNIDQEDILSFDLGFYNMDEPVLFGEHTELLSAPRLDNLTSVQACISSIIRAKEANTFSAIMLFDNEEIGSKTKQGADSMILSNLLEKIAISMGGDHIDFVNSCMNGILISCDVAHAIHPNRLTKNDPTNRVLLGDGLVLKKNSNQRYATDVLVSGLVENICKKYQIPHKNFFNRSDQRGGSTLGSMLSAMLCIRAVDCGVSLLSMHSARELMASADQSALTDFITAILSEEDKKYQ